jgi:hypothetical protein
MKNTRQRLIDKIKKDVDLCGLESELTINLKIHRPTLSWQHKTAGRMIWYWIINGHIIGSCEKMGDLLKSEKLVIYQPCSGDYEISSS